jgi:hypothetical protein
LSYLLSFFLPALPLIPSITSSLHPCSLGYHTRKRGRAARSTAGRRVLNRWFVPATMPYLGDAEKAR